MKKILASVLIVILAVGTFAGYKRINKIFPQRKEVVVEKGEFIKYDEGVSISVKDKKWLSEKETEQRIKNLRFDDQWQHKIMDVTFSIKNETDEKKKISFTDLYLETLGVANGLVLQLCTSDHSDYSNLRKEKELEPGEQKEVTIPYMMVSLHFQKKDWENIENRDFWITFSSYPEKIYLRL